MAEELRHLARYEKKNLVRGWNNRAQVSVAEYQSKQQRQSELHCNQPDTSSDNEGDHAWAADHQLEPNDRLVQWLRLESVPSSAVSSQWESQFRDHNQQHGQEGDRDEEDLEEAIPLTSGQVKHAYRTRARRQEAQETKRAVEMKAKRETLLGLQNYREPAMSRRKANQKSTQVGTLVVKSTRRSSDSSLPSPQAKAQDQPVDKDTGQEQLESQDPRVLELKNLPASRVCVDSEYRNEVLTMIRKQLISGRDVLLTSDCTSLTAAQDTGLSDTTLMMQQLCTQNLMYCVRDQEVVPQVDRSHQRVELQLRSRIPPS